MDSTNLPAMFYWAIGVLVVMNLGTIFSVFYGVFKVVWWAAQMDVKVERHGKDLNSAHDKIRLLERDKPCL